MIEPSPPRGEGVGRRERQQREIATELARHNYARVVVLTREHLAEFPEDDGVRAAAGIARRAAAPTEPDDQ